MSISRICNFFKCDNPEIEAMLNSENLPTDKVLAWSKLLEYDFFRIYSHHLILFAPPKAQSPKNIKENNSRRMPEFRKHLYTVEIIDFIMEQISNGEKTKLEVMRDYRIPKTTLYKWLEKYNNRKES
ncbi:transposase [Chryseobacterium sp. RG1]|uniref:Transposase n=2 Tax=Chryseobacterium tagetis TaxID=2801334 RepID=A0ABS8A1C2_9FLAO|nr:transposase [Chryseobacterium tagetis]